MLITHGLTITLMAEAHLRDTENKGFGSLKIGSLGLGITKGAGVGTEIWANNRFRNGLWKHLGWQMKFEPPLS